MKEYLVKPNYNFFAEVDIPGSKSITSRALILASLSENPVILKNPLFSDDTLHMIECLIKLGNKIMISEDKRFIKIIGNKKREFGKKTLYVGNAGTVLRFLLAYIATGTGEIVLEGSSRMNLRPIQELVDSLRELGITIEYLKESGFPPLRIISNKTKKGTVKVSGANSSQYLSAILLSATCFNHDTEIITTNKIISKSYVDITLNMIEDFGAKVEKTENGYLVKKGKYNTVKGYVIEGDMSSASYFLAAALITNSTIKLNNFFEDSIQGDSKILNILQNIGLEIIDRDDTSITVKGCESYPGFSLDLNATPDLVSTLATVALFANTPSELYNVANLRIKESDRLFAIRTEIKNINGSATEFKDGLKIIPKETKRYTGCSIETYNDHRIAMSFALAGLRIPDIVITNATCVNKTFPGFFEEFENLYAGGVDE
ncbi:3-phosphoshikimate 1-carboxyvinyltransferase [Fusobacterium sp. MFO224]|uniref:3-phosphoshikimate 1-carboxyvinyltransferase n=1 Tax=Fusobacterium sp. MFO224 TaxID=3378070 RepID=UPI0038533A0E